MYEYRKEQSLREARKLFVDKPILESLQINSTNAQFIAASEFSAKITSI